MDDELNESPITDDLDADDETDESGHSPKGGEEETEEEDKDSAGDIEE